MPPVSTRLGGANQSWSVAWVLSTLSRTVVEMTTSVAKYDRLEDLEDVVDCLALVTDLKVFGCTVDFVHPNTQTHRYDPM